MGRGRRGGNLLLDFWGGCGFVAFFADFVREEGGLVVFSCVGRDESSRVRNVDVQEMCRYSIANRTG